jgi:hypothetical protein
VTDERKTVEGLIDLIDSSIDTPLGSGYLFPDDREEIEAYARALVQQSVEQGSALQRLTDAGQTEKAFSELETMRAVAKSHHDELVAAQRRNAELLEALKMAIRQNVFDMVMTGDEMRACNNVIARAEAAQKGGA